MWTQVFNPLHNLALSALVAALPAFALYWALAVKRLKGWQAGLITAALALLIAVAVYRMPAPMALAATLHGACYGLFPIGWIVLTAVFLYNVTVKTGQFEVIQASIASITNDRRLQTLLIAFSFGSFLEGCAGFGAPVAITAGMLVGLGFDSFLAASLCLIANSAPVAFGSIGIPIITAGTVSGLSDFSIGQMVGRQLPLLSVLVPFWLMLMISGRKGLREVWPAALVCGGSYGLAQWWSSNTLGPLLPDIISSLSSIFCLVLFLKFWRPATIFRFHGEPPAPARPAGTLTPRRVLKAWSPFIVLTVLVGDWGLKPVKALLDVATIKIGVPLLHNAVLAPDGKPVAALYNLNSLSAAGTAILLTALITILITGLRPAAAFAVFRQTLAQLAFPLLTIASFLGYAYLGNASGMTRTMGEALAATGALFPLFSPVLGWLGVFITGSDTSSNAIFAKLQAVTAERLHLSPILAVAANSSGGVTGKMISPQSIAVACAATGMAGKESGLFRATFLHSLGFLAILGVMTWLQATVFPGLIPPAAPLAAAAATGPLAAGAAGIYYPGALILAVSAAALTLLVVSVRGKSAA